MLYSIYTGIQYFVCVFLMFTPQGSTVIKRGRLHEFRARHDLGNRALVELAFVVLTTRGATRDKKIDTTLTQQWG